ncbi:hypothetical protein EFY87_03225 [Flexivirga caeni]|uniref:Uncharacterized protein n=1 Tax=Flexivirga caeni TaxID=2294115 RepID=A0A3M9MIR6_9MICO|nr:hypothetical protein EFY87_03225 [Flexivirga caeni]
MLHCFSSGLKHRFELLVCGSTGLSHLAIGKPRHRAHGRGVAVADQQRTGCNRDPSLWAPAGRTQRNRPCTHEQRVGQQDLVGVRRQKSLQRLVLVRDAGRKPMDEVPVDLIRSGCQRHTIRARRKLANIDVSSSGQRRDPCASPFGSFRESTTDQSGHRMVPPDQLPGQLQQRRGFAVHGRRGHHHCRHRGIPPPP